MKGREEQLRGETRSQASRPLARQLAEMFIKLHWATLRSFEYLPFNLIFLRKVTHRFRHYRQCSQLKP